MKIYSFDEPLLKFANDYNECPRFGITNFETYDSQIGLNDTKPKDIVLGIIGTEQSFEQFEEWINLCSDFIEAKPSNQPNLFTSFCGFNEYSGFNAKMVYDSTYFRPIKNTEINKAIKDSKNKENRIEVIKEVAEIYLQNIKFLSENKNPKVIICLIPDKLFNKVLKPEKVEFEDVDRSDNDVETPKSLEEINFHHYLKAKSMQYKIPIQIVKERTLSTEQVSEKGKSDLQDLATRAWNFCTAVYYKAGGIPWKATVKDDKDLTCFVGISFYRSLDKETLQTSLAQIFDEQGKGVILRKGEVQIDKEDRKPHFTEEQAYEVLKDAIEAYKFAENVNPKRIVIHKSSKYTEQEVGGFIRAIEEKDVSTFDFITIYKKTDMRLFRTGNYPPLRGTCLQLSDNQRLLYTKASVNYFQTYAGMYIPEPIEIRLDEFNSSINQICREILSLTKMNWNNTQFDGQLPITIECSKNVGPIMKYLDEDEKPEIRYSFYM